MGRIVIPAAIRKRLDWQVQDEIDIGTDGNVVTLEKHSPNCVFCKGEESLFLIDGTPICADCIQKVRELT